MRRCERLASTVACALFMSLCNSYANVVSLLSMLAVTFEQPNRASAVLPMSSFYMMTECQLLALESQTYKVQSSV